MVYSKKARPPYINIYSIKLLKVVWSQIIIGLYLKFAFHLKSFMKQVLYCYKCYIRKRVFYLLVLSMRVDYRNFWIVHSINLLAYYIKFLLRTIQSYYLIITFWTNIQTYSFLHITRNSCFKTITKRQKRKKNYAKHSPICKVIQKNFTFRLFEREKFVLRESYMRVMILLKKILRQFLSVQKYQDLPN